MGPVTIRRAAQQDAAGIAQVQVETWRSSYRGIVPQAYLDAMDTAARALQWESWVADEAARTFVALADGVVCGFISGGALRDDVQVGALGYDAEIYTFYVSATRQGRGIGRELVRALAACLQEDGLSRPVVWALEKNPWCGFYERLGGERVGRKGIEIGGEPLIDVAYGWDNLTTLQT